MTATTQPQHRGDALKKRRSLFVRHTARGRHHGFQLRVFERDHDSILRVCRIQRIAAGITSPDLTAVFFNNVRAFLTQRD